MADKVLFVSATEYALEHFVGPYIECLSRSGCEVHVISGKNIGNFSCTEDIVRKSIDLRREPSPILDLIQCIKLVHYMRNHEISTLYTISPKAGLVGQLAGKLANVKRRVHFFTGQVWKTRSGASRFALKSLDKLVGALVTQGYIDSRTQADFLVNEKVIAETKAKVLGAGSVSGVVYEQFRFSDEHRDQVRQKYSIPPDCQLLFFLGRISRVKGILDLLDGFRLAYESNKSIRLLIVGPDDGVVESVKSKIAEYGLSNVVFGEWSSTPRPAIHYSAAEILCVPSYMEGFGNIVLEAACAGVPAIGSDIYGLQDAIVNGETGLLFPCGDVKGIAEAILRLADDKQLRLQLGEQAEERVKKEFNQGVLVKEFLTAHNQMQGR